MVMNDSGDRQELPLSSRPLYLLEVRPAPPKKSDASRLMPGNRNRRFLKVAYAQLSRTLQLVHQAGGEVLKITPISLLAAEGLTRIGVPWWIEIYTDYPQCLYYFGPFDNKTEARDAQAGFIEDLRQEGAEHFAVEIKQCQPQILTQEW